MRSSVWSQFLLFVRGTTTGGPNAHFFLVFFFEPGIKRDERLDVLGVKARREMWCGAAPLRARQAKGATKASSGPSLKTKLGSSVVTD